MNILSTVKLAALTAPSSLGGPSNFGQIIQTVTNFVLGLAGAIAVIMIVVGGIMYATSAGNDQQVAKAKNTILGAVVGLIIAVLAYSIISFVISSFR